MSNIGFKFQKLVIRKPELTHMLHHPYGEVGKYLRKRGKLIVAAAKKQVGVKTGELRESIHLRISRTPLGQEMRIGSSKNYALSHHEGTKPHIITPNDANILRFTAGGRVVYTHKVMHPGNRANKYLTDNLWMIRI